MLKEYEVIAHFTDESSVEMGKESLKIIKEPTTMITQMGDSMRPDADKDLNLL